MIIVTVGLGFGDEGKGTTVDYLVRKYQADWVVRYNGGAQAAHFVTLTNGHVHCFSQFGSGTFVPGVKTLLSRFVVIDPLTLIEEARFLEGAGQKDCLKRLFIDQDCLVVTPYQKYLNRILETARGENRHGSCGMGVGQTFQDWQKNPQATLYFKDLLDQDKINEKLNYQFYEKLDLAEQLLEENFGNQLLRVLVEDLKTRKPSKKIIRVFSNIGKKLTTGKNVVNEVFVRSVLNSHKTIIFEGAQGTLLDPNHGFFPHVTAISPSLANGNELLKLTEQAVIKLGIMRAYQTRHGKGPFVTQSDGLTATVIDQNNKTGQWQGEFRNGWLDLVALRYSLEINQGQVDELVITNLDGLSELSKIKICKSYQYVGKDFSKLNKYFYWRKLNSGKIKITGIKVVFKTDQEKREFTDMVYKCRPFEFKEFEGWHKMDQKFYLKAPNVKKFLEFLSSNRGLNLPIKLISVGPNWKNKIDL